MNQNQNQIQFSKINYGDKINNMNIYNYLSNVSKDSKCNYIKPFPFSKFNEIYPENGDLDSNNQILDVVGRLNRKVNIEDSLFKKCCDQKINTFDVGNKKFILDNLKKKYPSVKVVYNNNQSGKIDKLYLSYSPINSPEWGEFTNYLVCKISNSSKSTKIKRNVNNKLVNLLEITNLLEDCYTESCSDDIPSFEDIAGLNKPSKKEDINNYSTEMEHLKIVETIKNNNLNLLKELIFNKTDVNFRLLHDDRENTMLHIASHYGKEDIIDYLIMNKANINIKNWQGDTPLHSLNINSNVIAEKLLTQGADFGIKNKNGETPVFKAVLKKTIDLLYIFYKNGGSVIDIDNQGNNLIMYALKNSPDISIKIINFLAKKGLDLTKVNNDNQNSLSITRNRINKINLEIHQHQHQQQQQHQHQQQQQHQQKIFNSPDGNVNVTYINEKKLNNQLKKILSIETLLKRLINKQNQMNAALLEHKNCYNKDSPIELLDKVCVFRDTSKDPVYDITKEECDNLKGDYVQYSDSDNNNDISCAYEYTSDRSSIIENLDRNDLYPQFRSQESTLPKEITQINDEFIPSTSTTTWNKETSIPLESQDIPKGTIRESFQNIKNNKKAHSQESQNVLLFFIVIVIIMLVLKMTNGRI